MKFLIEAVDTLLAVAEAASIRHEVFWREWNLRVPTLSLDSVTRGLTLIARAERHAAPVAVLTVIETTGNHELHRNLGLSFPESARVARYTQLAVVKPYRGLDIPVQLVLAARQQFVEPRHIDYTWLLFDADRAASCSFRKHLGFQAGSETFNTEYGRSRVLVRKEGTASAPHDSKMVHSSLAVDSVVPRSLHAM